MAMRLIDLGNGSFRTEYDNPELENPLYGEAGGVINFPVAFNRVLPIEFFFDRLAVLLRLEAEKDLPVGAVYEIRVRSNFGGMAWYHLPKMRGLPLVEKAESFSQSEGDLNGYYVYGRYAVPESSP